ncbi:MAG: hypothetical protein DPW16_12940 [Chloroflexi bacterium]|nr:hypothetical protein [Chloroflexota bacterium]
MNHHATPETQEDDLELLIEASPFLDVLTRIIARLFGQGASTEDNASIEPSEDLKYEEES